METVLRTPKRRVPAVMAITGTFRLLATPPALVGSGTVPEAASELYPFGVPRKRGQGTGPRPAGPCAAPRGFVPLPHLLLRYNGAMNEQCITWLGLPGGHSPSHSGRRSFAEKKAILERQAAEDARQRSQLQGRRASISKRAVSSPRSNPSPRASFRRWGLPPQ